MVVRDVGSAVYLSSAALIVKDSKREGVYLVKT